ncbi:RNA polymerase sigma factor [Frigoriglobus tundricola]|uniref:RNA polymerase sigma-70 ECF-like HTH domain-containing protein n=1 Tax=Frigoriglobus tundricola TaxID=2774151 RepID=A0A6M5Z3V5_9BACT|nr:RNA polymerase sigma factor [Frigoriglobus tundricola]QJW99892.1 hypothetical protein FTUN_7515 [Frigoriglobus tundricola]
MCEPSFNTVHLQKCIDGWQAGDQTAANDLFRATDARLGKLARRMTRSFPNIRSQADTEDVLQSSFMRLLRTLRTLRPKTTRDFFNLAAVHIRRELLDLARKCRGRVHLALAGPDDSSAFGVTRAEPQAAVAEDFDLWVRFHQAVDELPTEEREVVGLVFYHGWKQVQIADLFGVDERTIRRRWARAVARLRTIVGTDMV